MSSATLLDVEAIRRACEQYGVQRLRIFGSALTDRFDVETSDVDFLVDFLPEREDLFNDYFDLKCELERIVGRDVDLVDAGSIHNPFFKKAVLESAQDIYAAEPLLAGLVWDAQHLGPRLSHRKPPHRVPVGDR